MPKSGLFLLLSRREKGTCALPTPVHHNVGDDILHSHHPARKCLSPTLFSPPVPMFPSPSPTLIFLRAVPWSLYSGRPFHRFAPDNFHPSSQCCCTPQATRPPSRCESCASSSAEWTRTSCWYGDAAHYWRVRIHHSSLVNRHANVAVDISATQQQTNGGLLPVSP